MKYIIPAVLAFLVGLSLWQLQRQRTALDYEVVTSEQFPRQAAVGRYFIVRLRNTGNKEVRDIDLALVLKTGTIEQRQFSEPGMIAQLNESPSRIEGHLPLMNPGEVFAVTVTGAGSTDVGPLEVTARAPGATATPRGEGSPFPPQWLEIVAAFLAAAAAISVYFSYRTSRVSDSIARIENLGEVSKRIEKTEGDLADRLEEQRIASEARNKELKELQSRREQGDPDSVELIFAIFNRAGIGHLFGEIALSDEIKYWRTALFLLFRFLSDEKDRDRYIAAAEAVVELPDMASSSRGFALYLLAKMEQFRGRSERAIYWFEQCRKITPLMHAHLMAQDPAYDLTKVRDYLRRGTPGPIPDLGADPN